MKNLYINNFKIHDWIAQMYYGVETPIKGLGYPLIRQSTYPKTGENGIQVSSILYGERTITLTGWILGPTASVYEFNRRTFEGLFSLETDVYDNPIPVILSGTTLDDLAFQIPCFPKTFTVDAQWTMGCNFTLELTAKNYYISSLSQNSVTITRAADGGMVYPVVYPIVMTGAVGGQANVINNGTVESFPLIYFNGPLTNPILNNHTLNEYIQLSLTLNSTDQLIVDMENKTAILNGSTSVNANIVGGSSYWNIEKGNNILSFLTDSVDDVGNVQILYYDNYIGI